jgi:hypothetical protein
MQWLGWSIGGLAALYGLHRLALWLEDRGHLYYTRKKSGGGGGGVGSFVAMQRIIEPQSQHVEQARFVEHRVEEDEATGRGESL